MAFSLRANPVVTRKDENRRPRRHDVVMDAKKRWGWQQVPGDERSPLAELIQRAGESWLAERLNRCGGRLEGVRADGYRQHRSYKKGVKHPIRMSSLDFEGKLTVTDPNRLLEALFRGIGPAKAFGFGLLLVRRA